MRTTATQLNDHLSVRIQSILALIVAGCPEIVTTFYQEIIKPSNPTVHHMPYGGIHHGLCKFAKELEFETHAVII